MASANEEQHWSSQREMTSPLGIRVLLWMYRFGGRPLFLVVACPVVFYYFIFARRARRASLAFLEQISSFNKEVSVSANWWWSYRHFVSFALSLLEQFTAWINVSNGLDVRFPDRELFSRLNREKQGAVILTSHLGNTEVCRALSTMYGDVKLNILVHTRHAEKFNKLLAGNNGHRQIELIQVGGLSAATAVMLSERISNGELVVMAADRTPVGGSGRQIDADFLGRSAQFPQGPFILASLLKCPVYTLFCLREKGGYKVHIDLFGEQLSLPRQERVAALRQHAQKFADTLAHYCCLAPLQWYNFYDFWQGKELSDRNE